MEQISDLPDQNQEADQRKKDIIKNSWSSHKDTATKIDSRNGYDMFSWSGDDGWRAYYLVKDEVPLGYVAGYIDLDTYSFQIGTAFVVPSMRKQGLGSMIYLSIINQGATLVSDTLRSAEAEALWQKLSRDPSIAVCKNKENRYVGKRT